jgi:hypothetical protein
MVGFQLNGGGVAGRFHLRFGDRLAVGIVALGRERAGLVVHHPFQVRIGFHCLPAQAFAVQEQFHLLAIAETPHIDGLALPARPVPMRQQVQHRPVRPPGLVIVVKVLGKPHMSMTPKCELMHGQP